MYMGKWLDVKFHNLIKRIYKVIQNWRHSFEETKKLLKKWLFIDNRQKN